MSIVEPKNFRDKLSMIDNMGRRVHIIPAEVRGYFRNLRNVTQAILVVLLLILPWIKINGAPAILLDISNRHFALFGYEFWAHDAPMIFFILAISAVSLVLITAIWGRAWCGWACPQTVFLDGVFRRIEYWTEGSHLKRRELARAPLSLSKFLKKSAKWFLFILSTLVVTHSFLAYFVGADNVLGMMTQSPYENWGSFVFVFVLSGIFLFNFVWFREQFCIIMCPYGRLQSVLYDKHTITVQYDEKRGEPRRSKETPQSQQGDCVSCSRCVQVCPTGIDIRDGIQMECIACTACIDACDEIMDKVQKPRGLIRYMPSVSKLDYKLWRPRVIAYLSVLLVLILSFVFVLSQRTDLHLQVLRSSDVPYFEKIDQDIHFVVNSYRLHIKNQSGRALELNVQIIADPPVNTQNWKLQIPRSQLTLKPNDFKMLPFLIEIPKTDLPPNGNLKFKLAVNGQLKEISFVGPGN